MVDSPLYSVFDDFLRRHPRGVLIGKLILAWDEIVSQVMGADYSQRTKAVKIANGRLTVHCVDTVIKSEIDLHREKLLTAYRERFENLLFTDIYGVYQLSGFSNEISNEISNGISNGISAEATRTTGATGARADSNFLRSSETLSELRDDFSLPAEKTVTTSSKEVTIGESIGESIGENVGESIKESVHNKEQPYHESQYERVSPEGLSPSLPYSSPTRGRVSAAEPSRSSKPSRSPLSSEYTSNPHSSKRATAQKTQYNKKPYEKSYEKSHKKSYAPQKKTYGQYVSPRELQNCYPDIGITSAFLDGDDFYS